MSRWTSRYRIRHSIKRHGMIKNIEFWQLCRLYVPFRRLIQTIFTPCWGLNRSNSSNGQCHLHYLFGDSHCWRRQCPQNLATFGVGTTIKSIPLTSTHHCSGSLHLKLPPHTKQKVNRIDLIVVPTPKVAKFWALVAPTLATSEVKWVQILVLKSIFTCCVGCSCL